MRLFDDEEKPDLFDEEEKVRLFETFERSTRSFKDYAKVILPIVVLVLIVMAVIMYQSRPQIGDNVRPDQDLYDAVYDNMLTQQKRQARDMNFYYCGTFDAAEIAVVPKPIAGARWEDAATQFKAVARKSDDGSWQVKAFPLRPNEPFHPCEDASFGTGQ